MLKRWMSKHQVMNALDLTKAEIDHLVKKCDLPAYSKDGYQITVPNYKEIARQYKDNPAYVKVRNNATRHFEEKFKDAMFKPEDVMDCLKEHMPEIHSMIIRHGQQTPPVKTVATTSTAPAPAATPAPAPATTKATEPITVPAGTTWHQINMGIINAECMAVKYPGGHRNLMLGKAGLTDALWKVLVNLAIGKGEFHYLEAEEKKNVAIRATVKRLNSFLKTLIPGITEPERPIIGTNGKYKSVFGITHQLDMRAIERGMAEPNDKPRSLHDELSEEFFSDIR